MIPVQFTRFLTVAASFQFGLPPVLPNGFVVTNLDTTGLLMEWDIVFTNTPSADVAVIRIANLDEFVQIPILEAKAGDPLFFGPSQASFSFGWEKTVYQCFTGGVLKIIPRIKSGPDLISEITIGSVPEYSTPAGVELSQASWLALFEVLAASMSLKLSFQFKRALLTNPVATTNATLTASAGNQPAKDFSVLVASLGPGINWNVANGEIFLLNEGVWADSTPPQILSPSTGLLEVSPIDVGGAQIKALGNPSVRPGQQILLQQTAGLLGGVPKRVESVRFTGSTNSGCTMDIVARRLNVFV